MYLVKNINTEEEAKAAIKAINKRHKKKYNSNSINILSTNTGMLYLYNGNNSAILDNSNIYKSMPENYTSHTIYTKEQLLKRVVCGGE